MIDRLALAMFEKFIVIGQLTITVGTSKPVTLYGKASGPNVDIHIAGSHILRRMVITPDLAIGEAYMDGTLTIPNDDLDGLLRLLMDNVETWKSHPMGRYACC